jgi:hypothetical protein
MTDDKTFVPWIITLQFFQLIQCFKIGWLGTWGEFHRMVPG